MKKILIFAISIALTLTATAQQKTFIDLSSVDKFFEIADKIQSNKDVSENDWNDLFSTSGYSISFPFELRKEIIRDMLIVAFSNNQQIKRDSILNLSTEIIVQNPIVRLTQLKLINFLDIKEHQKKLKLFRETYDFDAIKNRSVDRVKSFFTPPMVDTFLVFPSINLLVQEQDAQFNSDGIMWDFNKFYKSTEEERVNTLAHEMFHTYRANFVNNNINSYLFQELNNIQDEGITDLIDKTDDMVKSFGLEGMPQEFIDLFVSTYENTPQILKKLDVLTLSFINKEISEEQFNEKVKGFFLFGGHANGYYIAKLIKNAGLMNEMLKTFYSPVEFLKLYNKVAKKENIYVLSDEFIKYAENLEKIN